MSSSNRCDVSGQAPSDSNERKKQLRFLDFPSEIRIQIYQYLLSTIHVTERKENPAFFAINQFAELDKDYEPRNRLVYGGVRCQNVWIERSSYSLSILRVNRQVYLESADVFASNQWICVRVNRHWFVEDLKGRGFNVIPVKSDKSAKISLLTLLITYARSADRFYEFVMSLADASKLQRALSTSHALETAKLTFMVGRNFPKEDNAVTQVFSKFQSIGHASVCGPGDAHSLGRMTRKITEITLLTFHPTEMVTAVMLARLQDSLTWAQAQEGRNNWRMLAATCEAEILYVIDCHAMYESLIPELSPSYDHQFDVVIEKIEEIYTKLLLLLIEAQFAMRDYEAVLLFSRHATGPYAPSDTAIPRSFYRRATMELERRCGFVGPDNLDWLEERPHRRMSAGFEQSSPGSPILDGPGVYLHDLLRTGWL